MKLLKYLLGFVLITILIYSCGSTSTTNNSKEKEEPVVIANDSLEYRIIILDIGFNTYLNSIAQPEGYYSQNYMEVRNIAWVNAWNSRVISPQRFDANIYENRIDYQSNIDYGYEVNYKLFNYFLFAQRKYKMNLGGGFRANRIN